eukprot:jgi/Botrbrau1/5985/Bobra.104_1s0016.1
MVASPKKRRLKIPFFWFGTRRSGSPLLPGVREKSFAAYPQRTKKSVARWKWIVAGLLVFWVLCRLFPTRMAQQALRMRQYQPQHSPSRSVILRMRYRAMQDKQDLNFMLGCLPGDKMCTPSKYPTADVAAPAIDSISLEQLRARSLPFHPGGLYVMETVEINGDGVDLLEYAGQVSLVVNAAPNTWDSRLELARLQELYERYKRQGFVVLMFPSDDFNGMAPWPDRVIDAYVVQTEHCSFPVFQKAPLNGNGTHPVIRFLKEHLPGGDPVTGAVGTNFNLTRPWTKFLVDHRGMPVRLYGGMHDCGNPEAALEDDIQEQLRIKKDAEYWPAPTRKTAHEDGVRGVQRSVQQPVDTAVVHLQEAISATINS